MPQVFEQSLFLFWGGMGGRPKTDRNGFFSSFLLCKEDRCKKGVDPKNRNWFFLFGQDRRRKEETDGFFGRIFLGWVGKGRSLAAVLFESDNP